MKIDRYLLVLVLICLMFFLPFFIKPAILTAKNNDFGRTYIPLFSFFRASFQKYNQIPLWRPSQMMGESLVANPLSSLPYPPNILFLFLPATLGAIIYLLLHFLISAISSYNLSRSYGLSRLSSVAAGVFYTFSVKFLFQLTAGHITMLAAYSYFPLVFLSLRKLLKERNLNYLLVGSLSLAVIYITYPTIFYYSAIFIVIYTFYYLFTNIKKTKFSFKKFSKPLFILMLFISLSVLLSSVSLIPNLEFGPLSTRSYLKIEDIAIPIWNLRRFLLSAVFPYKILGLLDHESILYLGIVPMILGLCGFYFLPAFKKLIVFFGFFATLVFLAGTSTPFFRLAYNFLPLLKYSRVTTRPYFIVIMLVSLISAYALEKLNVKKLIIVSMAVFLAESLFLFETKLKSIPNLDFTNRGIYQYLGNDTSVYRVYCTTYCFNPQLLEEYGIQMLAGETPIQEKKFVDFIQKAGGYKYSDFAVIFPPYQVWQNADPPQPDPILLGKANVKYVASSYPLISPDFIFIKKFDKINLYRNKKFMDRSYFTDLESIKTQIYSPNLIYTTFQPKSYDREVVVSENYYPGWKAYFNKLPKPTLQKDGVFISVKVPAFSSEMELKYQPESFEFGKTVSVATLVFLLLCIPKLKKNGAKK